MAWIKDLSMLFSISVLIIFANGNVIRLDKTLNGIIIPSDADVEDNSWYDDNTDMHLNNFINLDDSSPLRLKDTKTYTFGNVHQYHHKTSVHHFARHGLCRNINGKVRFYTALKSKFCNTKGKFIAQIIDDLCADKGRQLDIWIAELFDLNEDGTIDHFEKIFYDD